jgi:cell division protein FtsZ
MIQFELPKEQSSIIKVIGVGGGGSNAVNHMFSQDIDGVNFVICNTDAQALALSEVSNKIQLGPHLTQGLGAGANPEIGKQAVQESMEEIRKILEVNTKMVFITAGMGGGTGTGGAPILARMCQEMGILTVGIVTTPFSYEGKKRIQQAEEGIAELKKYVDTLLVISNDKLRHQFGNLTMRAAFSKADNVLATAAKCITDVISTTGQINLDFADVCTVMRNGGVAILGSAVAGGEDRAKRAIEMALNSPLLNDNDIRGAKWILININSSEGDNEFTMDEVEVIQSYLLAHAGSEANVLVGMGFDEELNDNIGITVIATGFEHRDPFKGTMIPEEMPNAADQKIMLHLGAEPETGKQDPPQAQQETAAPEARSEDLRPRLAEVPTVQTVVSSSPAKVAPVPEPIERFVLGAPAVEKKELAESAEAQQIEKDDTPDMGGVRLVLKDDTAPETEILLPSSHPKPVERTTATQETHQMREQYADQHKRASSSGTPGGFLAKPSNIYAEVPAEPRAERTEPRENLVETNIIEDRPVSDMKVVIKESEQAGGPDTPRIHALLGSVEEPAMQDEADDQRRKAAERLHKLRNLSFNLNASDPNSEFDSVPAYVRRNLEMYNNAHLESVEKFYSNYSVKGDDDNKGQISVLNSFLNGKKPD